MNKQKFRVGQKVRVRKNLKVNKPYDGSLLFVKEMSKHRGKEAVITEKNGLGRFRLDIDDGTWAWSTSMLEPYTTKRGRPKKVKDPLLNLKPGDILVDKDGEYRKVIDMGARMTFHVHSPEQIDNTNYDYTTFAGIKKLNVRLYTPPKPKLYKFKANKKYTKEEVMKIIGEEK